MKLATGAYGSAIVRKKSKPVKKLLLLVFLLLAFQSKAASTIIYADSSAQIENLRKVQVVYSRGRFSVEDRFAYKLSKEDFEEQYAFNDTARAVIRLFFQKRTAALRLGSAMGLPLLIVSAAGTKRTQTVSLRGVSAPKTSYEPFVVPALIGIGAVWVYVLIKAGHFSKKSLLER